MRVKFSQTQKYTLHSTKINKFIESISTLHVKIGEVFRDGKFSLQIWCI